ncbi:efflux transporter, RND family, MFP subunit [Halothece sp. PCC 7418]|uniref:efflux RND transporter periplasmic adaptor subunit n=1 Tax=Halothece sp. (strain PCC 7418) TaxID=65093 RepID=UPI0002A05E25|nr:efflux RND transporter periplasmic adaptor subunit [Halothece sp. PCC 7418]AFZ45172.1 efflux transporter, RND family, MFP subunit [Halothece sp. PCC 7418]
MVLDQVGVLISKKGKRSFLTLLLSSLFVPTLIGCGKQFNASVTAQPSENQGEAESLAKVESAIAQVKSLNSPLTVKGDTFPQQVVALRSQAEGQLQTLTVDVGDPVEKGQILAQLNDNLLQTNIAEAEAELASRLAEVKQAQNQVRNAKIQLEQAQAEAEQAQADSRRLKNLSQQGAIPKQEAELAETEAIVAQKQVRAAREQIQIEQDAVATAQEQVRVQRSIIAQTQERLSYSTLKSPITGVVLERVTDPGNLIEPGDEVLTIGDFQTIKVRVNVSELALGEIRQGQSVTINLDAFPNESYTGTVSRISPAANPETRQVPIEITLPNPERRIGSGLLARVTFPREETEQVVIPETALQAEQKNNTATIFILNPTTEPPTVEAKTVQLGDRANNQVEILSGLDSETPYIVRSSRPLQSGEAVRLSAVSRTTTEEERGDKN